MLHYLSNISTLFRDYIAKPFVFSFGLSLDAISTKLCPNSWVYLNPGTSCASSKRKELFMTSLNRKNSELILLRLITLKSKVMP